MVGVLETAAFSAIAVGFWSYLFLKYGSTCMQQFPHARPPGVVDQWPNLNPTPPLSSPANPVPLPVPYDGNEEGIGLQTNTNVNVNVNEPVNVCEPPAATTTGTGTGTTGSIAETEITDSWAEAFTESEATTGSGTGQMEIGSGTGSGTEISTLPTPTATEGVTGTGTGSGTVNGGISPSTTEPIVPEPELVPESVATVETEISGGTECSATTETTPTETVPQTETNPEVTEPEAVTEVEATCITEEATTEGTTEPTGTGTATETTTTTVPASQSQSSSSSRPPESPKGPPVLETALLKDLMPPISDKCRQGYLMNGGGGGGGASTGSFQYTLKHTPLNPPQSWDWTSYSHEPELFAAELSHDDPNDPDRSWKLRVGRSGIIYSFEFSSRRIQAMPPQRHDKAPFIDEVWQNVCVDTDRNVPEEQGGKGKYFVHQAGVYSNYDDLYSRPFYSPSVLLAPHCSSSSSSSDDDNNNNNNNNKNGEAFCTFASWGQQAHVPSVHRSPVLYLNRYADCGDGILEVTSVVHNLPNYLLEKDFADQTTTDKNNHRQSYLNIPWGGVRTTSLKGLAVSQPDGKLNQIFPVPKFGDGVVVPLAATGGFTTFSQNPKLVNPSYSFPEGIGIIDDLNNNLSPGTCPPPGSHNNTTNGTATYPHSNSHSHNSNVAAFDLIVAGRASLSQVHMDQRGGVVPVIRLPIQQTREVRTGERDCSMHALTFTNTRTQATLNVLEVVHWAWRGNELYFVPYTANVPHLSPTQLVDTLFTLTDRIRVTWADIGYPPQQDMSLTFIHGRGQIPSRLRYGTTSMERDYTVYTINFILGLNPGDSVIARNFVMVDRMDRTEERAFPWSSATQQSIVNGGFPLSGNNHNPTTSVTLWADLPTKTFGAFVPGLISADRFTGEGKSCICSGYTIPQRLPGSKLSLALWHIQCNDRRYTGPDLYHFAPVVPNNNDGTGTTSHLENPPQRLATHRCKDEPPNSPVRPQWTLIGYFAPNACDFLQTDYTYDPYFPSTVTATATA